MTLREYFESKYRRQRLLGKPATTVRAYRSAIATLERHAGGPVELDQLGDDLLADAMQSVLDAGNAVATANRLLRHVRAVWHHAGDLVPAKCGLRLLTEPRRIVRTWRPDQFDQLLEHLAGIDGFVATWPANVWWFGLVLTNYYTGLRVGALITAEAAALDLAGAELVVRAEEQKHGADQVFALPPDLVSALEPLAPCGRRYLFAWPFDRHANGQYNGTWSTLRAHLRRHLVDAKLPATAKHLWHNIRRLTGTRAAATGGVDAARRLLDHSANSVTQRYVDVHQAPNRVRPADLLPAPNVTPPPGVRLRVFADNQRRGNHAG